MLLVEHSSKFPGRDMDSLCRKFSIRHRRKMPMGDPDIPLEIRIVKRVKFKIGGKMELDDGTEKYDMMGFMLVIKLADIRLNDDNDNLVDEEEHVPLTVIIPLVTVATIAEKLDGTVRSLIPTQNTPWGLITRGTHINMMHLFMLQMQSDARHKARNTQKMMFERREIAADCTQLTQIIGSIDKGYFDQKESIKGSRIKKKRKSSNYYRDEVGSSSSDGRNNSNSKSGGGDRDIDFLETKNS